MEDATRNHLRSVFGESVRFDEPLSKHTYYQIGGPAMIFFQPKNLDEIQSWIKECQRFDDLKDLPVFIMGWGSNLLVSDDGFPGIVIRMKDACVDLQVDDVNHLIHVGASITVNRLLTIAKEKGLDGLQCLAGIPGYVGGVIAMNAGTHLGEIKDRVKEVQVLDLKTGDSFTKILTPSDFSYRENHFLKPNQVILSATLSYSATDPMVLTQLIDETLKRRKDSQPLNKPSCGSVFRNPEGTDLRAWQVVDRLGLRGHQIGRAQIAEKHPNFILNLGGASAQDVRSLMDLVIKRAKDELGIAMIPEVKWVG